MEIMQQKDYSEANDASKIQENPNDSKGVEEYGKKNDDGLVCKRSFARRSIY